MATRTKETQLVSDFPVEDFFELFETAPEADTTIDRWMRPVAILYHAYRWFVLTGRPPAPADWRAGDGWPDPDEVLQFFRTWERFLDSTGIMDSPMVEMVGALYTILKEAQERDEERARQHDQRVKKLAKEETRIRDREQKLAGRADRATTERNTARRQLQAARQELADVTKQLTVTSQQLQTLASAKDQLEHKLQELRTAPVAELPEGAPMYRVHTPFKPSDYDQALKIVRNWVAGGEHALTLAAVKQGVCTLPTGQNDTDLRVVADHDAQTDMVTVTYTEPYLQQGLNARVRWVAAVYRTEHDAGMLLSASLISDVHIVGRVNLPAVDLPSRLVEQVPLLADDDWDRRSEPVRVDTQDVPELCAFLLSYERQLPVLVLTQTTMNGPVVNDRDLAQRLCGLAHVVVISRAASFQLTDTLGADLSVWGGAARLYPAGEEQHPSQTVFLSPAAVSNDPTLTTMVWRITQGAMMMPAPGGLRHTLANLRNDLAAGPDGNVNQQVQMDLQALAENAGANAAQLRELADSLEQQLEAERERSAALARSLAQISASSSGAGTEQQEVAASRHQEQAFTTVLEATRQAATDSRDLLFSARAFQSATASPYRRPQDIYDTLMILDQLAGEYKHGSLGMKLSERAFALGLDWRGGVGQTTASKHPTKYQFLHEGAQLQIGPHVVVGNGSGAGLHARIYLAVHEGDSQVDRGFYVAHVGRHLPDSTTG